MLSLMKKAIAPRFNMLKNSNSSENTSERSIVIPIYDNASLPRQHVGMVMDVPETSVIAEILSVVNGSTTNDRCAFSYSRPDFLHFTSDETHLSSDKFIRPVLCPKFALPVYAGYAEVINCGKSKLNEDMATVKILKICQKGYDAEKAIDLSKALKKTFPKKVEEPNLSSNFVSIELNKSSNSIQSVKRFLSDEDLLPLSSSFSSDDEFAVPTADFVYFAIFDGHAGSETAIMASKLLHEHVKSKLSEVLDSVLHLYREEMFRKTSSKNLSKSDFLNDFKPEISSDSLIIGALESAFLEMDDKIGIEKSINRLPGGCATIVALIFFNKIFIANAGDCRALLISPRSFKQLSNDFNPATDRKRLQNVAYRNREFLANSFSRLEYSRHLTGKDLNSKVLYRDWNMDGWAVKTVKESDIKFPLISKGKKPRLLNTIGVSRGLGDHNLMTVDDKISIKPFLSASPEVTVFDTISMSSLSERDVLILASDGFWDVFSNEEVFELVNSSFNTDENNLFTSTNDLSKKLNNDETTKYTLLAQDLAAAARGNPVDNCRWRLSSGGCASLDDITVFVIPLKFALNLTSEEIDDDEELLNVI